MRITFIYLVLFFVLCITIFNLFYKKNLFLQPKRNVVKLDVIPFSTLDKLFCPINGFKCPDETCDCLDYCKGSYEKINIFDNEDIVLFNEKLAPGTYCLPKGALKCHLKSSIPIYSNNDWICVPRNQNIWNSNNFIACKSPYAKNNNLNVLFDHKTNDIALSVSKDYYEMYNGKLRYECKCNSKDVRGNPMISLEEIPFTCVSDYCLANFKNVQQAIGWKNGECDCGPYSQDDKTSPCIDSLIGMKDNVFHGVVKCTSKHSFKKELIYSNDKTFWQFDKTITFTSLPVEFLKIK